MFLSRPLLPLSNTVPISTNFLCHARIDRRDGGSLPYLVLKFRSEFWSLQIRFGFNKPWHTLCLLFKSSHFVRDSFNSIILFINSVPEMQYDKNLDNHWVHRIWRRYLINLFYVINAWNCKETLWTPKWGYVIDIVYRTKVRDITNLKQRITDAIATIDEGMLQRTWQEIEYRFYVLRATNGAHTVVY